MVPPRKDNDKLRPDDEPGELPVHKHTAINGPQQPPPDREYRVSQAVNDETGRLADAVERLERERHWTTGAYCLAIGLMIGLLVGWASAI